MIRFGQMTMFLQFNANLTPYSQGETLMTPKAKEILITGKNIVKDQLRELHENHGLPLEIVSTYDVIESEEESFAVFKVHGLVRDLVEEEVSSRQIQDQFNFSFGESSGKSEDYGTIRLEFNGKECFVLGSILSSIVDEMQRAEKDFAKKDSKK